MPKRLMAPVGLTMDRSEPPSQPAGAGMDLATRARQRRAGAEPVRSGLHNGADNEAHNETRHDAQGVTPVGVCCAGEYPDAVIADGALQAMQAEQAARDGDTAPRWQSDEDAQSRHAAESPSMVLSLMAALPWPVARTLSPVTHKSAGAAAAAGEGHARQTDASGQTARVAAQHADAFTSQAETPLTLSDAAGFTPLSRKAVMAVTGTSNSKKPTGATTVMDGTAGTGARAVRLKDATGAPPVTALSDRSASGMNQAGEAGHRQPSRPDLQSDAVHAEAGGAPRPRHSVGPAHATGAMTAAGAGADGAHDSESLRRKTPGGATDAIGVALTSSHLSNVPTMPSSARSDSQGAPGSMSSNPVDQADSRLPDGSLIYRFSQGSTPATVRVQVTPPAHPDAPAHVQVTPQTPRATRIMAEAAHLQAPPRLQVTIESGAAASGAVASGAAASGAVASGALASGPLAPTAIQAAAIAQAAVGSFTGPSPGGASGASATPISPTRRRRKEQP